MTEREILFKKIKSLEEEYLNIWDANVEFKKGYKGYDAYISEILDLVEAKEAIVIDNL